MSLKCIKVENGVVTLESDYDGSRNGSYAPAISELRDPSARRLAIAEAVKTGVSSPACGMGSQPYPVDADGNVVATRLPEDPPVYRYRIDISVTQGSL